MKFILGKKLNMTQVWIDDKVVAVTSVLAGPCTVVQIKNKTTDGYEALKLAFGEKKEKNIKKPQLGQLKNLNIRPRHLKEFRIEDTANFKVGDVINVETFNVDDTVNVTGTSKGKGFQGVVKRHGFHGFRKTHGNKDQERMPGSIGPKGPAHVFKGTRMGGRMGNAQVTTTNVKIIKVDIENNILFIQGSVPGSTNGLVMIKGLGELKVNLKPTKPELKEEIKTEDIEEMKVETMEGEKETTESEVPQINPEETKVETETKKVDSEAPQV